MSLDKFIQELKLRPDIRPNTIKNNKRVLEPLNKYKPLDKCNADDIKKYIEKYIQNFEAKYNKKPDIGNLNFIYSGIRKYYLWAGKPDKVSWIKTKNTLKKINQNKLLTPSEIQTMLRVCDNDRDKCLIAMGYESGMRIGELLSLRVEDIKILENEYQIRIPDNHEGKDVNCKTGSRTMTLIESLPYVQKYLNIHTGETRLFNIKISRSQEILKNTAKKAGITKNVHWHLLRHTRATELANLGMQETQLKRRFGWTGDSKMIDRYVSNGDTDADNAYKEALGLSIKIKDNTVNPIARRCAKCGKLIDTGEYCPQCSEIQRLIKLNEKSQIDKEELMQRLNNQEAETFILKHNVEIFEKFLDASSKIIESLEKGSIKPEQIKDTMVELELSESQFIYFKKLLKMFLENTGPDSKN